MFVSLLCRLGWLLPLAVALGCGSTQKYQATEQLLLSEAVDNSVSTIDFRPLAGRKVYLDTNYMRTVKSVGFVNADYVTSSLRQQIIAAGCKLQENEKAADLIIEARLGTLGADDHRMTYGIPENNAVNSTVSLLPNAPLVPQLPEISVARRESREAAAKIAAFAYDKETRQAVWQSGISQSSSTAKDTWVMGVGPFQGGTIRNQTRLAGSEYIRFGHQARSRIDESLERPPVDFTAETRFQEGWPMLDRNTGGMLDGTLQETNQQAAEIAGKSAEEALKR